MHTFKRAATAVLALAAVAASAAPAVAQGAPGLWRLYDQTLSRARYIDLTHPITPSMPVWKGFGATMFAPSATGCLLDIGFPRFRGGLGGYARYVAICPPATRAGTRISARDAPLPAYASPLHWDASLGYRVR
jgi:hypothetical protein